MVGLVNRGNSARVTGLLKMNSYVSVHGIVDIMPSVSDSSGPLTCIQIAAHTPQTSRLEAQFFLDGTTKERGDTLRTFAVRLLNAMAEAGVTITGVSYARENGRTRFVGGCTVETPHDATIGTPFDWQRSWTQTISRPHGAASQ